MSTDIETPATETKAPEAPKAASAETAETRAQALSESPETAPASGADENAINQLQSDIGRFRDLALRTQADFENYRKRAAREKEDAVRFANFSVFERLIPILDNFELGLSAARTAEGDGAKPIVEGMEMVRRQLVDFLNQHGVETIDAEGKPFDPNLHEAVSQEPSDSVPEGSVTRQIRKGYRLKDRLLRASMVIVSGGPAS